MHEPVDLEIEHIADSAFWLGDAEHRHHVFAALRRDHPVRWYEPRTSAFQRRCSGFWALTRYDDVREASRDAVRFCSGQGIDIEEAPAELGAERRSMINFDDPEHFHLRRLVSSAFTPARVAQLDDDLRRTAARIIDDVIDRFAPDEEFDFVANVASLLPLDAICDLMGVPQADRPQLFAWSAQAAGIDDPASGVGRALEAVTRLEEYASSLGRERLRRPAGDLTSGLMYAEIDGVRLTDEEFVNFFGLLIAAGNETTRNSISHGVRLLTEHGDQRRIWFDDFERHAATAVDEIVRFETPITHMCRVLTVDTVMSDVELRAGDKVALWYTSANRDADAFDRPDVFDVRRPLRPQQMAYGGGGPHFCLGANLARREMTVMFDEIRRRLPELRVTGEPVRLVSMSSNAVVSMPAARGSERSGPV
jgi:cytochrome P450